MQDLVAWLYGLQSHGVKLGLDGIRALLELLDHPEVGIPVILVGGTNGKGSVAAMLDALLRAHRRRTGLYTSPHLVRPNERIRIDGDDVSTPELERLLATVRDACECGLSQGRLRAHPSFFEVITAAALLAFRDARVDAAVLEVGLGGRLDATNATEPSVSAIVTVDFDHVAILGPTIRAIALEKLGIARAGCPLVSGVNQPEAIDAMAARCASIGADFIDARDASLPPGLRLPLDGEHQRSNARVALAAFTAFANSIDLRPDANSVRDGFAATRWPGRLQLVPGAPPTLLDGAHNASGAEALAAHLAARGAPKPVLVFGAMEDKDALGLLRPLAPYVASVVTTRAPVLRAADPAALAVQARSFGLEAGSHPDPAEALARARALAGPAGLVLVAGSLYLVGATLAAIEGGGAPGPVSM